MVRRYCVNSSAHHRVFSFFSTAGSKGKKNSRESSSKETRSGKRSREASSSKDSDSNGPGSATSLDADGGIGLEPNSSCSSLETEGASSRAESSDSPSSPDSYKNATSGDLTAEKKPKRARTSFTSTQLQILEFYFMACPYPDTTARSQIAKTANIDENTVQVRCRPISFATSSLFHFLRSGSKTGVLAIAKENSHIILFSDH